MTISIKVDDIDDENLQYLLDFYGYEIRNNEYASFRYLTSIFVTLLDEKLKRQGL